MPCVRVWFLAVLLVLYTTELLIMWFPTALINTSIYYLALCCLLPCFIFLSTDCKEAEGCEYVLPVAGCTMRRLASICGNVQLNIMLFFVYEPL
jgi:hypothetical protein